MTQTQQTQLTAFLIAEQERFYRLAYSYLHNREESLDAVQVLTFRNDTLEQEDYRLDLAAGRELTLADLLGENWVEICNDAIRTQMAEAEDPSVYFDEDMGGFDTVDENTAFYCNAEGEAVVVFPRGMVAVGYLGTVEFVISEA